MSRIMWTTGRDLMTNDQRVTKDLETQSIMTAGHLFLNIQLTSLLRETHAFNSQLMSRTYTGSSYLTYKAQPDR